MGASSGRRITIASPNMSPFLVPPKERRSTPASVVMRGQGDVERRGGVRETGAVDVEEDVHGVRALGDGGDLCGV